MFPETFASSAYIFSMFSSFAIQKALFPKAKYVAVVLENMEETCARAIRMFLEICFLVLPRPYVYLCY